MALLRLLVLTAVALAAPGAHAAEPLRMTVVPWREAVYLQQMYAPTVELLARKLARPVQVRVASDYEEVTQAVAAGAADLAIYGPEGYVHAKRLHPRIRYLATCLQPDDHYYSLIVARKDAQIAGLADLKGRSFGLTERQSTSGYLVPRAMLARAGIDLEQDLRVFMLRRHPRVFDAVAQAMTDAGAATSTVWEEAVKKHGDVFVILERSSPLPRNPVVAAPHVGAALAARVRDILAGARDDAQFAQAPTDLKGYAVRSDRFYDTIRTLQ